MHDSLHPDQVRDAIAGALGGRLLLEHPFYQRWEAGQLAPVELAAYAEQYRHVERALPSVLEAVAGGLEPGAARQLVEANLDDERSVPEPHVELFEGFAAAAGARPDVAPTAATAALVALQVDTARRDPVAGLATVAAYEVQAAAVAVTKSAGLADRYSMGAAGTRFWDVHAAMEAAHADWSLDALALLATTPAQVAGPAAAAAAAWWSFLDEREAAAPVAG